MATRTRCLGGRGHGQAPHAWGGGTRRPGGATQGLWGRWAHPACRSPPRVYVPVGDGVTFVSQVNPFPSGLSFPSITGAFPCLTV